MVKRAIIGMFLRVRVVGMLIDKNTKEVRLGNVEIKRIMSGGGYCGKRKQYLDLLS